MTRNEAMMNLAVRVKGLGYELDFRLRNGGADEVEFWIEYTQTEIKHITEELIEELRYVDDE